MAYFLDIIIDTAEKVPISFRVNIDETTRKQLLTLHPTGTRLIHTIDPKQFKGIIIPHPKVDPLAKLKLDW